jgi:hypothetical protein
VLNQKTVYSALSWLLSKGLVSKTKCGNLNTPNKTAYFIRFGFSNMVSVAEEWRKLLHVKTRIEKREEKNQEEQYVKSVLKGEPLKEDLVKAWIMCGRYGYYTTNDSTGIEATELFLKFLRNTICQDCWLKRSMIVFTIFSKETFSYFCQECGFESDFGK